MAIITKNRKQLKSYFVKNAIPTEGNFADLVDSQLNQAEDGIFKIAGEPLSVVAAAGEQKRVLRLYASYPAANPDWLISLSPAQDPTNPATVRAGFGITDGAGNTRLFIDPATGNLGVGTNDPKDKLHVVDGDVRIEGGRYRRLKIVSDKYWAGIELVARQQGEDGHPHLDFTHGDLDAPNYGIRVLATTNNVLRVEAGAGTATLQVAGPVSTDGSLGVGTSDPQGSLDVRLPAGAGGWNRFVVNTTSLWGDGNTQYVTIGAGGAHGIMVHNQHVPWYAAESRASIRYGRSGGVGSGAFWDVGARTDNAFSLALNGSDHKMWLLANGNVGIGVSPEQRLDVNGTAKVRGDFLLEGSADLGWARATDNLNGFLRSGFHQANNPVGRVPDASHPWVHMITVRHANAGNHHQLQIASSYAENDKLYFRKIARDFVHGTSAWNEVATVANVQKIRAGEVSAGMPHQGGDRYVTVYVDFGYRFAGPPTVLVQLKGLDVDQGRNVRIVVWPQGISQTGCEVVFRTWSDSIVYSADATWIAIGV
jgi:hypothetical protein